MGFVVVFGLWSAVAVVAGCGRYLAHSCSDEQIRAIAGKCNSCGDNHRNQTVRKRLASLRERFPLSLATDKLTAFAELESTVPQHDSLHIRRNPTLKLGGA